jgi:hypothetical protein
VKALAIRVSSERNSQSMRRAIPFVVLISSSSGAGESIRMPGWSEPPPAASQPSAASTAEAKPSTPNGKDKDDLGAYTDQGTPPFVSASSRLAAFGYSASGKVLQGDNEYAALGGGVEGHLGRYGATGPAKMYFGYELRAGVGYQTAAEYKPARQGDEPEGGFTAFGEIGPAIVPLHWGGGLAGRIVLVPNVGLTLNKARFYENYGYVHLAGRLQFVLSPTLVATAQYGYTPWTGKQSVLIREHRVEASLQIEDYAFGFRYQRDMLATPESDRKSSADNLGGFAALLW